MSITSVCAGDANDTIMASEDTAQVILSQSNDAEGISVADDSQAMQKAYDEEKLTANSDWYVNASVSGGRGTYDRPYNNFASVLNNDDLQDGDTVYFAGGEIYKGTYNVNLEINKTLNLKKYGDGEAIFDAQGNSRIFHVSAKNISIDGLTFQNGEVSDDEDGGALRLVRGIITNCNFIDNSADTAGGAVFFWNGGNVTNCSFIDNTAMYGGAIAFDYDEGYVTNCNFTNNVAGQWGGAIQFEGTGYVTNCNFIDNSAKLGGAIEFKCGESNVSNCNFIDNSADTAGGAIYFDEESAGEVINCNFINNSADTAGGAIFFNEAAGEVMNCNFTNNSAGDDGGALYMYMSSGTVENCNFVNNVASTLGGAIYARSSSSAQTITNCNFTGNTANMNGGALYFFKNADVRNCNFIDNSATKWAGAIDLEDTGNVTNCTFINNSASQYGACFLNSANVTNCNFTNNKAITNYGAIQINHGSVENCNFVNNKVSGDGGMGGAVYSDSATVKNCNFVNNTANNGGALYMFSSGTVENCNFTDNTASSYGAAIYFYSNGNVTDCNFNNNSADYSGAVYFVSEGNVSNCNFNNNNARAGLGAAVQFNVKGKVTDCDFTDNKALYYGGAVFFNSDGTVINCNFVNNTASINEGGAVYFYGNGEVITSNFTNNKASFSKGGAVFFNKNGSVIGCDFADNSAGDNGGAVYFTKDSEVTNCIFIGNNATSGSAIYLQDDSTIKTISNSIFLDNRANVDIDTPFTFAQNGNKIAITFIGQNNQLNAIYSRDAEVDFTNVTYWGAKGIANTGMSTTKLPLSNKEAGQNITVVVVDNGILVLNTTKVTDEDGTIVIDLTAGNSVVTAYHNIDSYYTGAEENEIFDIAGDETNLELTGFERTVNATVNPGDATGNVSFTVSNESGVVRTVESTLSNGIAKLDLKGLEAGKYNITAIYKGNINYYPCNSTEAYEIIKKDSTILIDVANITTDKSEIINITVNGVKDKNVTVYVNKDEYNINTGTLTLTGLDEGIYNVTAIWQGDDYYKNVSNSTKFWAIKNIEYYVNVTPVTTNVFIVNITAKSNIPQDIIRGKLEFILPNGDKLSANYNPDGTWWAVYTFDDYGDYNVGADYSGLDGVTINDATISIREDTPIYVNDMNVGFGDVNVLVIVSEAINGQNITITVNTTSKNAIVKNGKANASFNDLPVGEYVITAAYSGDSRNAANSTNANLIINKAASTLSIGNITLENGNTIRITVTTEGTTGITAKIGDKEVTVKGYEIAIPLVDAGDLNLTVTTIPDENHYGVNETVTITVNNIVKINTPISLNVSIDEDYVTFTVNVSPDASGIVKFEVSGAEEYTVYADVIDGVAVMEDVLVVGDYEVVATYMGDNRFNTNITSERFTVKGHIKKDTPISADANVNGNKVTISVNVDVNATGFVRLKQSESIFYIALEDGASSYVTTLPAGSYNIDVTYLGDDNYNENSTKLLFTVVDAEKENTAISLDVETFENNGVFTVIVNENATGIVKFDLSGDNGYVSYSDVKNGEAVLIAFLEKGNYTLTVTYMGDDRFNSNTTFEGFEVKGHVKKDTPISAEAKVNGNKVTITANVDENATGFVNFKFSDNEFNVALTGGVGTLNVNLPANSYSVDVAYLGDENFNENSTKISFTVTDPVKENTPITLDVSSIENNATYTVSLNPDATGIVRFEVSGAEEYTVYADVIDGVAVLDDVLSIGDYTVVATYLGDDRFNSNITSESFTIKGHVKKDTPISAEVKINGNKVTITVNVNESATGFIGLKQSGSTIYVELKDGVATYVNTVSAGSYNVEVIYPGDDNYNENRTRVLFTVVEVGKENTTIALDVSSVENNATYTVSLNPDATGIVRFEVSGAEEYTVYADVIDGVAVLDDVLSIGDYTVVATYLGDDRFNTNATSASFTIKGHIKKNTPISADAKVNGNKVTITVNVNESATGYIGLKQSESTIFVELEDGVATYVTTLPAGSYNIEVIYPGDDNYNENTTHVFFNVVEVSKENTTIALDVSSVENNATYTVSLNPDATGIVRFEVSGAEEYTVYADVIDGVAVLDDVLSIGDYTVVATYLGDDRFNTNATSASFTIKGHIKKNTPISAEVKINGNKVTITVNVNESATGFIGLKQSGSTIYVELKDGVATYVNTVSAGSYNVEVIYPGDDNYNENRTRVLFTVVEAGKENTTIALDVETADNNATFIVDVNENATGIVKFEITGSEDYTVYMDVVDGKSVMERFMKAGNYTIAVTYMGDSRYNTNVTSKDFTVNDPEPVIVPKASEFSDITITDTQYLTAVLIDSDGNPIANATVTYAVNGIANTTLTAEDGQFTIKTENDALIAIGYAGNETIIGTNITLKLNSSAAPVIVKVATHFDVDNRAITINGYAVDTKAGEEGIYYATRLLDADGNPVSNVYMEFAVNNKIYNRTTYENGSYKPYKLNMIRAGRYTMALNFAGDDNYTNAFACVCFDLAKKPITIKASAKSYKASTKTKKYTVSLKTIVGSSHDGKAHLRSGLKVTLKVNGKTYSGKTNSKGKVTFKITNLKKKAKYVAKISYAGDKTYKSASKSVKLTIK